MNSGTIIDKERVRSSFSRQAPVYEQKALLQKDVAEKLISVLSSQICSNSSGISALDIGIGTGFATRMLSAEFPGIRSFGCDIAHGMLLEARDAGAVLAEADAENLPYKDESFDLAFSSLALQWTDLNSSMKEVFRILRAPGRICFSTFGERTLKELSDSYNSALALLNIDKAANTMKFESPLRIRTLMDAVGFRDVTIESDEVKSHYNSPEVLLRSLKTIGAGNPSKEFHPSRRLLQETYRIYRERYGDEDGISATFEIVYASGGKK